MIQLFFDGACEPINPGGTASYGFVIKENDSYVSSGHGIIGVGEGMTNNVAEYYGLIHALRRLDVLEIYDPIEVFGDSKMVVEMASGRWGKKRPHRKFPHLIPLLEECRNLLAKRVAALSWIPREMNSEADELSKAHLFI